MKKIIVNITDIINKYGYLGIIFRIKSKYLSFSTAARINPKILKNPVFLRTNSADLDTYHKIFIDEEYALDIAKSPKNILDCGAHIGLSSIYFAANYPDCRIISIEPESRNFKLLKKNVKNYPNIIPMRAALWNDVRELDVLDPGNDTWSYRVGAPRKNKSSKIIEKISGVTVDKIMQDYCIDFIDILKIDIEGAEKDVFENSSRWIDKVGVIAMELHDWRAGCREVVSRAVKDFEFGSEQGENTFFARSPYVQPTQSSTNPRAASWWQRSIRLGGD